MIYRIAIDGLLTEFKDSDAVLLNLTRKRYHFLNDTGAFIWSVLEKGPTSEEDLVAALRQKYDLSDSQARATTRRFNEELMALELIRTGEV